MAQSADSNLRRIPVFWPNHTVEPPTHWSNWIYQFHLAIFAQENIDIDNLKDLLESETDIPILEFAQGSEKETQKKAREVRIKEVKKVYDNAEDEKIAAEQR